MAGELVPLVLLPRYSTIASLISGSSFTTVAMDVTPYELAIVTVWRGLIVGTNPPDNTPAISAFKIWFEESMDQETWTVCGGSPIGGDPGKIETSPGPHFTPGQQQYGLALAKRWFRLRVELFNADNVASCWAVGFLQRRLT